MRSKAVYRPELWLKAISKLSQREQKNTELLQSYEQYKQPVMYVDQCVCVCDSAVRRIDPCV